MSFSLILVFVTGALTGIVAALKLIAPLTKTKADDKVEAFAEKALDVVVGLKAEKPKT